MAKTIGSIRVAVQPGLEKFRTTLKAELKRIENSHTLYIEVLPDVDRQRFRQAVKEAEALMGTVEANIEAVLDKDAVKATKARIKEEFGSEDAMIKALLDPERAKATEARIKTLFGSENMYIRPILNRVAAAKTRAQLDMAFASKDVRIQAVASRQALQSTKKVIDRELQGETVFRNVGAMWMPGTFDNLRHTFFTYFPSLKPWVWPQLNIPQLKKTGQDAVKNWQTYVSPLLKDVRSTVWTHVNQGSLTRVRGQLGMLKDVTSTVHLHLSKSSTYRSIAKANSLFGKSVKAVVSPVFDRVGASKTAATIRGWAKRQRPNVKIEASKMRASFATAGLLIASWAKRQRPKIQIHIDAAKAIAQASAKIYAFYKFIGLRRFRRITFQFGLSGTRAALLSMTALSAATMKLTAAFSVLSSMVTSFLSAMGLLRQSIAAMLPALGAVAGVAASIGAGFVAAGVALKDFGNQLPGIVTRLKGVKTQIVDAFWVMAKPRMLEGLSAAIGQIERDIDGLAAVMGDVFGGLALGLGKSVGEIHQIMGNTTAGFDVLANSSERFMRSLMRMLGAGTEFFPKFAAWLDGLIVKWEAWINQVEASEGGLVGWMQDGVDAARLFGSTIGNLFGLFFDVADIAASAGHGIAGFNDRLRSARATIAEPLVQSGLFDFFTGAHNGMYALTSGLTAVLRKFAEFGAEFGAIFEAVGGLVSNVFSGIADAIAQPVMLEGVRTLVGGFNSLVVALQPVVAHLGSLLGPLLAKIGGLLSKNAEPLAKFVDLLGEFALVTFDQLADLVGAVLPSLLEVANQIMPIFNRVIKELFPPFIGLVEQIVPMLADLVGSLLPPLIDIVLELAEPLGDIISAILPPLIEAIQGLIPPILRLVKAVLPLLVSLIEAMLPIFELVINILGAILPPIIDGITALIAAIIPVVTTVIDVFTAVATVASDVWTGIKDTVGAAINAVAAIIASVMLAIQTGWYAAWDAVKNAVSTIWGKIKGVFTGLREALSRAVAGVKDVLVAPFRKAKEAILGVFGGIKNAAKSVTDFAGKLNPFSKTFGKFADGGIVTGPTLGLVGEKPRVGGGFVPEAIIPLPRLQPMLDMAVSAAVRGQSVGVGVGAGYRVENLNVSLTGADVRDVRSIAEFVDMLNVEARMRAGV